MSPDIRMQAHLLAAGLLTGAGLMALYDVLRVFRLLVRHGWLWTGIEDLLYWVISGFLTFLLLYRENDGAIRFYVVAAVFLAMVVYDRTFSRFFLKWLKKAAGCIRMKMKRNRQ